MLTPSLEASMMQDYLAHLGCTLQIMHDHPDFIADLRSHLCNMMAYLGSCTCLGRQCQVPMALAGLMEAHHLHTSLVRLQSLSSV